MWSEARFNFSKATTCKELALDGLQEPVEGGRYVFCTGILFHKTEARASKRVKTGKVTRAFDDGSRPAVRWPSMWGTLLNRIGCRATARIFHFCTRANAGTIARTFSRMILSSTLGLVPWLSMSQFVEQVFATCCRNNF